MPSKILSATLIAAVALASTGSITFADERPGARRAALAADEPRKQWTVELELVDQGGGKDDHITVSLALAGGSCSSVSGMRSDLSYSVRVCDHGRESDGQPAMTFDVKRGVTAKAGRTEQEFSVYALVTPDKAVTIGRLTYADGAITVNAKVVAP